MCQTNDGNTIGNVLWYINCLINKSFWVFENKVVPHYKYFVLDHFFALSFNIVGFKGYVKYLFQTCELHAIGTYCECTYDISLVFQCWVYFNLYFVLGNLS
jgi:hypothetical protein